jgi:rhodanese-related sulfurtransferase
MLKALAVAAAAFAALPAVAADIASSVDAGSLPDSRTTPLGLYLSSEDAHSALTADPGIVFLDVRDPVEIAYIGHAEGVDAIVPLRITTHEFDGRGGLKSQDNPAFLDQAKAIIAREGGGAETPIFVICRSGGRSAVAARMLIDAGYTNVWNLVEGFEGDKNDAGARAVNGWRNAGLPWTYTISEAMAWSD